MAVNRAGEEWWSKFHVAEMADLFLERKSPEEMNETVSFLIRHLKLRAGDRVFDQCCGIGNVSMALAGQGMTCCGVDLCEVYIDRAKESLRETSLPCEFFCDDALTFRASLPCQGAINWYSSFGYSSNDDRNLQMMLRAFESLQSGGVYALDVPNVPSLIRNFQHYLVRHGTNREGRSVTVIRESQLDLTTGQLLQEWRWLVESKPADCRNSALRLYMPHQLSEMLTKAGFVDISLFGGIDDSPLTMNSSRLLITGRKP